MVIVCKDTCRHYKEDKIKKELRGETYYCKTCSAYLPNCLLNEKRRCGCCSNLVRFKPRQDAEYRMRKALHREGIQIAEQEPTDDVNLNTVVSV